MQSVRFAVPFWNSAAALEAVSVNAEPGVAGATFITNVEAFVIELTVALFASPEPDNAMPATRPTVLSHVTVVLAAVVVQFVSVMPAAVSPSPVPVATALADITKVVASVTELILAPADTFGPVTAMPGHKLAVLAQVTVALPPVVAHAVSPMGAVWFDVPTACRT